MSGSFFNLWVWLWLGCAVLSAIFAMLRGRNALAYLVAGLLIAPILLLVQLLAPIVILTLAMRPRGQAGAPPIFRQAAQAAAVRFRLSDDPGTGPTIEG